MLDLCVLRLGLSVLWLNLSVPMLLKGRYFFYNTESKLSRWSLAPGMIQIELPSSELTLQPRDVLQNIATEQSTSLGAIHGGIFGKVKIISRSFKKKT